MTDSRPAGVPRPRVWLRATARFLSLGLVAACLAAPASGQLISIKTVPIAEGDQFAMYPSERLGMAGVSIALADTLLDPFGNPAMGSRLDGARFFGSPTLYSISQQSGGGRTLPLGALLRSGAWYGGLAVAVQEIESTRRDFPTVFPETRTPALSEQSRYNRYALAMLGKSFPDARASVAGSIRWAGLSRVDGVELLYAGSQGIAQSGHAVDIRLGLLREWEGDRTMEAVLVHNRFRMTHDVTYADWFWDPMRGQAVPQPRQEHNLDRTNTSGVHLRYDRPLTETGWRVGGLVTANLMSHPKIPNYEIMNIPRDPGHSQAFNLGLGFSRIDGPSTAGIDLIYEPIWSNTWAEAESAIETSSGATIPKGGKTIENDFRFSNALLRMGIGQDVLLGGTGNLAGFQLGLAVRSIHYWLEQYDNVLEFGRHQEEQWIEWMPTWGISFRFPEIELRYSGRQLNGTGRPGVASRGGLELADSAPSGRSIIVAPSGPLTLDAVRVVTHQVSVTLPLR